MEACLRVLLHAVLLRAIAVAAVTANANCGACSLVITELEAGIAAVGKDKKIQVGSFRVNPKGNQEGLSNIPYARSETHIHDLLDNICEKSHQYSLVVHPTTGKSVYVRKEIANTAGDNSKSTLAKLNHACSDFLDDYEDDVVKFVREEHDDPVREFCHTKIGICTSVDVAPFPSVSSTSSEAETATNNDEL